MLARIPMTARQRAELLALPDSEAGVIAHYSLDAGDLAAIGTARNGASFVFPDQCSRCRLRRRSVRPT